MERTTFELLEVGDKFRTIGKITGNLSLYVYEKTSPLKGQDEVTYNSIITGAKVERRASFNGDERVERV